VRRLISVKDYFDILASLVRRRSLGLFERYKFDLPAIEDGVSIKPRA
jgi:hypothetical protein